MTKALQTIQRALDLAMAFCGRTQVGQVDGRGLREVVAGLGGARLMLRLHATQRAAAELNAP